MKYILHIKLPTNASKMQQAEIKNEMDPRLKEDYIIIVTSGCDIEVYPKGIYQLSKLKSDLLAWFKRLFSNNGKR